jgi:SAM-dependent methyltransferase
MSDPEAAYDAVAGEYARRIYGELSHKPFDRALLDRFAAAVKDQGPAADVGCGPGHVARYLHERGVRMVGIDLSAQMIEQARALNPGIDFARGDMRKLDLADGSLAGVVAFYSLIHIPREEVTEVLRELARVLRPDGLLLVGFHVGTQVLHLDDWWERPVSVDFVFFEPAEMRGYLEAAGFRVDEVLEREPYAPEVEHQSRRCYVLARAATIRPTSS